MKTVRLGVIGVDAKRRGGHARLAHQPEKGYEIVAGADTNPAALAEFREHFGPNTYITTDYRELLRQPLDGVFIMTPDFLHEEQAVATLEAGKGVYLEKPLALTIAGCDRVLDAARRSGSKLFVGHNMRYYPSVLKMKEIIDAGMIGDVRACWCRHFINYGGIAYFCDWHAEQRYVNGLLLQKGAHDIDVIHYLLGSYTTRVSGMGMLSVYNHCATLPPGAPRPEFDDLPYPPSELRQCNVKMDVEDHNMILMQLANGTQACYMQCHYSPDAERNYTVIGTRGRLENIGDAGACEIQVWTSRGSRQQPDAVFRLRETAGGHGGSDPNTVAAFLEYLRGDAPCRISPVAARQAVATGVLAHESMRGDGGCRTIPPLTPELEAHFRRAEKTIKQK